MCILLLLFLILLPFVCRLPGLCKKFWQFSRNFNLVGLLTAGIGRKVQFWGLVLQKRADARAFRY